MKLYKTINQENGSINIYGSNRSIEVKYSIPEWETNGTQHAYFRYQNRRYYLSEFLSIRYCDGLNPLKEFDGYMNDSYFSGIAVKINNGDSVKAYTFIL